VVAFAVADEKIFNKWAEDSRVPKCLLDCRLQKINVGWKIAFRLNHYEGVPFRAVGIYQDIGARVPQPRLDIERTVA
jgi:hypothetical protein